MRFLEVLVTGSAGFIGVSVTKALRAEGISVVGFDAKEGKDIADAGALRKACEGVDGVVHLAAITGVAYSVAHPAETMKANVEGTRNVLEAARAAGAKTFVFASSASVYGDAQGAVFEDTPTNPKSPYAESKLAGEKLVTDYSHRHGMRGVSLRLFNVYGPRQNAGYGAVIPSFVKAAKEGKNITINGDGKQTRDFVFVEDAAKAFALSLKKGSGVYNIGSGKAASIRTLAEKIISLTGSHSEITFEDARQGDVRDSLADITKARRELGFVPGYTLEQGLKETVTL
ncbi:L-arabinose 1-dehydrogenase (NAD(P)(+)) [Candidatus Norongarragalina meridionalis]|nr:L-arabinose 1-dehydrogenase (NAD(P)(+)) [Candidatus Norongarragalina meridionalis]